MPKPILPPDVVEQSKDLDNWIPAGELHEHRKNVVTPRNSRTLRDERHNNGLAELGAYAQVGRKQILCLPIFDWWVFNYNKVA